MDTMILTEEEFSSNNSQKKERGDNSEKIQIEELRKLTEENISKFKPSEEEDDEGDEEEKQKNRKKISINEESEDFNKFLAGSKAVIEELDKINDNVERYNDENKENITEIARLKKELGKGYCVLSRLFLDAVGQCYEGVLVKDCLSARKGKLYPYRCQYRLSAHTVAQHLASGLASGEIQVKLTPLKVQQIRWLVGLITKYELEDDYYQQETKSGRFLNNTRWGNSRNKSQAEFLFEKPFEIIRKIYKKDDGNFEIETTKVSSIGIDANGEIYFKDENEREDISLTNDIAGLLKATFKKDINNLTIGYITTLTNFVNELHNDLGLMKTKCAKLLICASISNEPERRNN